MRKPTDFYFMTLQKEVKNSSASFKPDKCITGGRRYDIYDKYLHKLITTLKANDFFSLFWSSLVTHNDANYGYLLDQHMLNLFQSYEKHNIFNKTFIFFLSDHGIRFGNFRQTYEGRFECSMPLMIHLLPKWFELKYEKAIKNLRINAKRLTTPFDVYATLRDLINLKLIENHAITERQNSLQLMLKNSKNLPRGISLFLEIPPERNCENAHIDPSFCTCHNVKPLSLNDTRIQKAALKAVKHINTSLKEYSQCYVLELFTTLKGSLAEAYKEITKNIDSDVDITVQFQTKPGLAIFEATVRFFGNWYEVIGTISRVNEYKNQSHCIEDPNIKLYCFCKIQSN